MLKILFFGPVVERVGCASMALDFQVGSSLQDVVTQLQSRYPSAFEIVCFIALNQVQTRDMATRLSDHDEIAFMAKFSGG